jgi:hypothetical protein
MTLHPDVQRYADALLRLEHHLRANGDTDRAGQVRRCRIAAERSDGWSVDYFLSLFGFMGDFNAAGLPGVTADPETVNRQLSDYIKEAKRLAKSLQKDAAQPPQRA